MGLFDMFRRREPEQKKVEEPKPVNVVGAKDDADEYMQGFNNSNITFSGNLKGFDYDKIQRNKQENIIDLYKLADYYTDADAIVRGIIRHVYSPYTISSPWILLGTNEKTRKIYEEYYKKIRLREKLEGIALEYWKYSNVYVYIMDGVPITLPVHKCRIGNLAVNGEPIVDFDCQSILNEWRQKNYVVKENWIKDNSLEEYFKGYPPEVREALNANVQWAQLNPKYTKVLQGNKESWQRYSIPFIAACLPALAKKELISSYENALLNLGIRSFVHVQYGDKTKGQDILPDINQLQAIRGVISRAMSNFPLAVTNQLAEAHVIQPDMNDLFQFDKYKDVNNDILSAGGISGIIVSGLSEDGSTFASAQVSMQTAATRIEAARDEIAELMNKINVCIQETLLKNHVYNVKQIPEFKFMPLDMSGMKALRDSCTELWQSGLVSTRTMLETHGYSLDKEKALREQEVNDGTECTMIPRDMMWDMINKENNNDSQNNDNQNNNNQNNDNDGPGRPEMDETERNSDPDNAMRGKQPKPSNPDGSLPDDS